MIPSQKPWQDLITIALVGTEKQNLDDLNIPEDKIGNLLKNINQQNYSPEKKLLQMAGVLSVYHHIGHHQIKKINQSLPLCDRENLPVCSPNLKQTLRTIFTGQYRNILPECLQLIAQKNQLVPEDLLPQLLDQGHIDVGLRPLIISVMGERGKWLGKINLDWYYVNGEFDQQLWDLAIHSFRLTLLRQLRQKTPAQARIILENNWKDLKSEVRQELLETLSINISLEDEDFLESILLNDRSKYVRQKSASLLAQLKDSRFSQRMKERLKSYLIFSPGENPKLEIILPETYTPEMEKDAIIEQPPSKQGEKAWWLGQMLQTVSPDYWCQIWQISPETLLQLTKGIWQEILLKNLALAVVNHRLREWGKLLLKEYLNQLEPEIIQKILENLAPEAQEEFLLKLLDIYEKEDTVMKSSDLLINILKNYHQPWTKEVSLSFIKNLFATLERLGNNADWNLYQIVEVAGARIFPFLHPQYSKMFQEAKNIPFGWRERIEKFLISIQFRLQMYS